MANASGTMPAIFIGHGSPMNTLEDNKFTRSWAELGQRMPRPRAVLAISAHWYFGATAVTAMAQPRTIHDFYGFPQQLFDVEYPAPGLPELAQEIAEVVKPHWVGADRDQWGLDHGTWSVLKHLYPAADIPVVQLSLNALRPLDYHLELGSALAEMRKRGVLILASGNVVHNLGELDRRDPGGKPWAHRFDDAATDLMAQQPGDVLKLAEHPDFNAAVPTPDHFIPLLYLSALAAKDGETVNSFNRDCTLGSLSMTCHAIGIDCPEQQGSSDFHMPEGVPPDQSNI